MDHFQRWKITEHVNEISLLSRNFLANIIRVLQQPKDISSKKVPEKKKEGLVFSKQKGQVYFVEIGWLLVPLSLFKKWMIWSKQSLRHQKTLLKLPESNSLPPEKCGSGRPAFAVGKSQDFSGAMFVSGRVPQTSKKPPKTHIYFWLWQGMQRKSTNKSCTHILESNVKILFQNDCGVKPPNLHTHSIHVYLPTFTINFNRSGRSIYHTWYGMVYKISAKALPISGEIPTHLAAIDDAPHFWGLTGKEMMASTNLNMKKHWDKNGEIQKH